MSLAPPVRSLLDDPLVRRSAEVLHAGQAPSGALVACSAYATYDYAWLRDGSFCAHALDVLGERPAASAFHRWVATSIESHRALVEAAIANPDPNRMPPARYTLDGALESPDDDEPWPNFQIDGYGMWLWAFERHVAGGSVEPDLLRAVRLTADYLSACWELSCFNCWEEFDGGEHASTLAASAAGLRAASRLLDEEAFADRADAVVTRLRERFVVEGRFRRGARDDRLDGSLAWLAVPFEVVAPGDPLMQATAAAIADELGGPGGGIRRYVGDTFYGGGQWPLLTSSLAWHYRVIGDESTAAALQEWVRERALPNGDLPEQVSTDAQDQTMIEPWVRRWGPVATPLLWSHAMYVLAEAAR